jgi:hypothetical protein
VDALDPEFMFSWLICEKLFTLPKNDATELVSGDAVPPLLTVNGLFDEDVTLVTAVRSSVPPEDRLTERVDGYVTNTVLVPAVNTTALFEFDERYTVVRVSMRPVASSVPKPTSNSFATLGLTIQ